MLNVSRPVQKIGLNRLFSFFDNVVRFKIQSFTSL